MLPKIEQLQANSNDIGITHIQYIYTYMLAIYIYISGSVSLDMRGEKGGCSIFTICSNLNVA